MFKENGIQDVLLDIGRSGCYFLCLIKIAEIVLEKPISILETYHKMFSMGYIKKNCFVLNPKAILENLLDRYCYFEWKDASYKGTSGEFIVKRWVYKNGNSEISHFVLYDGNDKEIFNSLRSSAAVVFGKVQDMRVFEVKK